MRTTTNELWVAGYPSSVGGADTELDHNIDLWCKQGVQVHLVPMFGVHAPMQALCEARGCQTHEYHPGVFRDKVVVSFCNGEFLARLPEIVAAGKPAAVVWFNCMTWAFEAELEAHRQGWIDFFGFVSEYQKGWLLPKLEAVAPVRELEGYRPYFSPDNLSQELRFNYRKPHDWFAMGRVSRDDGAKFSADMWNIFHKVCSPRPTKTFVLGFGQHAHEKCGDPPPGLDWMAWEPGALRVPEFYDRLHLLIHKTGGSRESYGRVIPEAYASGVPVIVEDDYAFPDLVLDGMTGFRCQSSDEMSFRASQLAFDEPLRKRMVYAARDFLLHDIAAPDKCWRAWKSLLCDS